MFCNFLLQLNMAKRRHAFLARFVLKLGKKINWRKTKFALTCSLQKVIRALAFSGPEKNRQFISFQNSWYSLIASSISFNLI